MAESGDADAKERAEGALPAEAVEAWRTWLLTGKPGVVTDRRRVRGSHRGLKHMLVDGTGNDLPDSWKHFSGAMVRLAINDALNALPKDQTHAVWLAYFGGMSNSEIARRLGLTVGGVQRRLNRAFDLVSDYVEHGRSVGRRAMFFAFGWLSLRRLEDFFRQGPHPTLTDAFVAAGATAAVMIGVASTGQVATPHFAPATVTSVAAPPTAVSSPPSTGLNAATQSLKGSTASITKAAVRVPVNVPQPPTVSPPPLPSPPPVPSPPPLPSLP